MSDPVTWAYIGMAVSGGTALYSGYTQKQQADTEADVAKKNAEAAAQQASAAEDAQRRRSRSILARQRAAIAESGIGFGGSSETLQQDSAVQAELDALKPLYERLQEAQRESTRAFQAEIDRLLDDVSTLAVVAQDLGSVVASRARRGSPS